MRAPPVNPAERIGRAACEALLFEARLTPKPGLVDTDNSGAHADMDLALLERSAKALHPYFIRFAARGEAFSDVPPDGLLSEIRPDGLEAERAMFSATGGVNAHKGAIFLLGALCFAAGRMNKRGEALFPIGVAADAGRVCRGVTRELERGAGRAYARYGASGARGEAEAGYPSVLFAALPAYHAAREAGASERDAWLLALLRLIAAIEDANVLARCGADIALWLRREADAIAQAHPAGGASLVNAIAALDARCRLFGASPGGAADLLACAVFLNSLDAAALTRPPGGNMRNSESNPEQKRFFDVDAACAEICARVNTLRAKQGRVLLAIDGCCCAGKSTAAARLSELLGADMFHMDDFFLPPIKRTEARLAEPGGNVDAERFLSEVLEPLSEGRSFSYRRYDCRADAFSAPTHVEPRDVSIVEGAYSLHPLLAPYYDLKLFWRVGGGAQLERVRARNGDAALERFRTHWIPLEDAYFAAFAIEQTCDITFFS